MTERTQTRNQTIVAIDEESAIRAAFDLLTERYPDPRGIAGAWTLVSIRPSALRKIFPDTAADAFDTTFERVLHD